MKNVSTKTAGSTELTNDLVIDNGRDRYQIQLLKKRLTTQLKIKERLSEQGKDFTHQQFVIDNLSNLVKAKSHLIENRSKLIEVI